MGEIIVTADKLGDVMKAEPSCYRKKRNPDGTFTVWYRADRHASDVLAQMQAASKPARKSKKDDDDTAD